MRPTGDNFRVALVSPRYAAGSAGGAENLVQGWAERLSGRGHSVEVLTTCARDHFTWKNHFPSGTSRVNGVSVTRFPVNPRDAELYHRLQELICRGEKISFPEEEAWLDNGVVSDGLCRYLDRNRGRFDAVIFAPYLFGTTYRGTAIVGEKAVLVPCLHDEPFARLETTRKLFSTARAVFFNTPAEKDLAQAIFDLPDDKSRIIGMGVEPPEKIEPQRFRTRIGTQVPFILYTGRREGGKNTPLLVEYFHLFHRSHSPQLNLVLAGSGPVAIPARAREYILDAGYLEERQKWNAYGAARVFCQPSTNESFSIVLLESWLAGRPALVNSFCPVTKTHARLGNGGLWFRDYLEFEESLLYLLQNPRAAEQMGAAGRDYVSKNYNWNSVIGRLEKALEEIRG